MNYSKILLLLIITWLIYILYNSCSAILPFAISIILAYLLNPLLSFAPKTKPKLRILFILAITIIFYIFLLTVLSLVTPLIYKQINRLIIDIPLYKNKLDTLIENLINEKLDILDPLIKTKISQLTKDAMDQAILTTHENLKKLGNYTLSAIHLLLIILLIPILLFFILLDFHKLYFIIIDLIPKIYRTQTILIVQ